MKAIAGVFSIIGFSLTLMISIGLYLDVQEMDHTEGGYEPPFTGVTGEIIDWDSMDRSNTSLIRRGHVVNFIVNGTTGMISLEFFGIEFEARKQGENMNDF